MTTDIERVGDFGLGWGESLVWDDRRQRLYFVDCGAGTLHWLEGGEGQLQTLPMPSMPTGIVATENGLIVGALDDGLHVIDPDRGSTELLASYPAELGGRANDVVADLSGNLITGTLNLAKSPGSSWWFSLTAGWRLLDADISNTNGPTVGVFGGEMRLIIGDSHADYFWYSYDAASGRVGPRSIFGDTAELHGVPDGTTLDADGGLWCSLFGGSCLARFTTGGLDRILPLPAVNPADVTFAGPELDRLYVVTVPQGPEGAEFDGGLLVMDSLGVRGRPEPRFAAV